MKYKVVKLKDKNQQQIEVKEAILTDRTKIEILHPGG